MPRHTTLDRILQLDPQRDHQEIVSLTSSYEFPFDVTRSLEFALFRTFAVPSVSELLDHTGEFQQRPQKRYDDTDLLLSALYEYGYDSERGRAALRRKLVEGLLKLRARLMRLLPERQRPRLRTEMKHRSYPNGYRLEELGPPHPGDRQ